MRVERGLATLFGIGHMPLAPGTWAAAAAIPIAWGLHAAGGFPLLAAATVVAFAGGWWAVDRYLGGVDADPAEVVVDELAGMLIALWPLSLGLWLQGVEAHVFPWPGWLGAFVLFRVFDILKPWPVRWAERQPGAGGVMFDDLIAGLVAAALVTLAAGVAHGWV